MILRDGCICRGLRLAPPRRDATPPPPFSLHAQLPLDPDLIAAQSSPTPSTRTPPTSVPLTSSIQPPVDSNDKAVAPSAASTPSTPTPSTSHTPNSNEASHTAAPSALHPRVAVILGVDRRWYVPLLVCRALSTVPAAWWGLRCAFTFLAELLQIRPGMGHEGWAAAIIGTIGQDWDVERRFRVTEVALAIMWVCERDSPPSRRCVTTMLTICDLV